MCRKRLRIGAAEALNCSGRLQSRGRFESKTRASIGVHLNDRVVRVFPLPAKPQARRSKEIAMQLQDHPRGNGNEVVGLVDERKHVPIPKYLLLVAVPGSHPLANDLSKTGVARVDALDTVRRARALYQGDLPERLKGIGTKPLHRRLPAPVFVNRRKRCHDRRRQQGVKLFRNQEPPHRTTSSLG